MKTMLKSFLLATTFAAAFTFNTTARAEAEVGKPAPDFTLTDIGGKTHSLSQYKGKVVVLEWVNPECPIVLNHYNAKNMQDTQKVAAADGAIWLQINSAGYEGAQGNFTEAQAAEWLQKHGAVSTAYFRDRTSKVGRLYDAKTTPHMFVVNKEGVLVYNGAIDSGNSRNIPTATNYVKAALASLKAGKPVEKATSTPYGCSMKFAKES